MNFNKFFLLILILTIDIYGQNFELYSLGPEFHKSRRDILRESLPDNSVSVFFSYPEQYRSINQKYQYKQDSNFYYLSGLIEPNAVLIIFSNDQTDSIGKFDEIIFVQKKSKYNDLWESNRIGLDGAKKLGIKRVKSVSDFLIPSIDFNTFDNIYFFDFNNIVDDKKDKFDLYDLVESFKNQLNFDKNKISLNSKVLFELMSSLRESKTLQELDLLKKAIQITCIGFIEVMKYIKPGMSEREIQGIHEFVHKKYGIANVGFPSIIGSGNNGCILHYTKNNAIMKNNDLVLMDVGAEYMGYSADISRTIPVNGIFNSEQKKVYEIVYNAQEAGIKNAIINNTYKNIYNASYKVIADGLMDLNIIDHPKDAKKYFPHGSSHHIGLDVHDSTNYGLYKENAVVTVEPGIYIPVGSNCDKKWWGIAIRIEDDILITKEGPIILSDILPRKLNEIERLMENKSILSNFLIPKLE